jgi:hypothetical protein
MLAYRLVANRVASPRLACATWAFIAVGHRCSRTCSKMRMTLEGTAVFRKQRDHAATVGVVAILLGLIIIGGISYTYMTRPALIEAATKRVLDIRQLFEDTFR